MGRRAEFSRELKNAWGYHGMIAARGKKEEQDKDIQVSRLKPFP